MKEEIKKQIDFFLSEEVIILSSVKNWTRLFTVITIISTVILLVLTFNTTGIINTLLWINWVISIISIHYSAKILGGYKTLTAILKKLLF